MLICFQCFWKRKENKNRVELNHLCMLKNIYCSMWVKRLSIPLFDNMHDFDPGNRSVSKEIHVSSSNPSRRVSSNATDLSDDTYGTRHCLLPLMVHIRVDLHLLSLIKCMIPHPMHVTKPVAKCHPLIPLTEVDLQVNPASQMICMMLLC